MKAVLSFTGGPYEGNKLEIPNNPTMFGREGDATIQLNDEAVSRHHAELRNENGQWAIVDLDSANGTQVNGQDITHHPLKDGDQVEIGATQFQFMVEADSSKPKEVEPSKASHPSRHIPAGSETSAEDLALVQEMRERTDLIRAEIGKVIVGQADVLEQLLMCIVASGHALLIGLPGMAKTLTVSTLAKVLNLDFKRVQFTPDLMPSDIIGTDILETNQTTGEKEFRFIQGPIFCNLLLADEINRTPPKTQAALLEAMQEKRVTAGNTTYDMAEPFFVLATQNPIEQEGTYPLPEAQLDRFMFNIWVDYPEEHEEEAIVSATTAGKVAEVKAVMTQKEILQIQDVVRKVPVSEHVIKYAIRLVRATRPSNPKAPEITRTYVSTGAGPRAGQYLVLAAKAMAILEGRLHVSCNDIRRAAIPVLRHRILINFTADSEGKTTTALIDDLIKQVPEPSEEDYRNA